MRQYSFETLSDFEFEQLARDLLQLKLELPLESFRPGRDSGIDLRFTSHYQETLIVQCKHYVRSGASKLKSHLKAQEVPKVRKLTPSRYLLVTSAALSPRDKDDIISIFDPYILSTSDVLGREDLNGLLSQHPKIEHSHYKLWLASTDVLSAIVHSKTKNQTRVAIRAIQHDLRFYVQSSSHAEALRILDGANFCIITGAPGVGKTTLANALFLQLVTKDYDPVRAYSGIDECYELLLPDERQVFLFDDFLGATAFDPSILDRNEEQKLVAFLREVARKDSNKKLILTTRDYILNQALLSQESLKSIGLNSHQCEVRLDSYSRLDRARILYNHLYFSDIDFKHITDLLRDRRYLQVIDHPNYSPRVIEWFTQMERWRPTADHDFAIAMLAALNDPRDLWRSAYEHHISHASKLLLLALVTLPVHTRINDLKAAFEPLYDAVSRRLNIAMRATAFREALEELENSFIVINRWPDSNLVIRFHNPSIRDYLEAFLEDEPANAKLLTKHAVFFDQLKWLWGKHRIGGLGSKSPYPVPPRLRSILLEDPDDFTASLSRTLNAKNPTLKGRERRRTSLAERLQFVLQVNRTLQCDALQSLVADTIPDLRVRESTGQESAFELIRLADQLGNSPMVRDLVPPIVSGLSNYSDFERFLVFKLRHSRHVSADDNRAVDQRFQELYPGRELSHLETVLAQHDYDEPEDDLDFSFANARSRTKRDVPSSTDRIVHLFESLTSDRG